MSKKFTRLASVFLFIFGVIVSLTYVSCQKEYSCENCQTCALDTVTDLVDTGWRFNIGAKLFYGSDSVSYIDPRKVNFSFLGYSHYPPPAIISFAAYVDSSFFAKSQRNFPINEIFAYYGKASGVIQAEGSFANKPHGLKGVIKSFDLITKTVEGSFCGIVSDTLGHDLQLTNGRFKIKLP